MDAGEVIIKVVAIVWLLHLIHVFIRWCAGYGLMRGFLFSWTKTSSHIFTKDFWRERDYSWSGFLSLVIFILLLVPAIIVILYFLDL